VSKISRIRPVDPTMAGRSPKRALMVDLRKVIRQAVEQTNNADARSLLCSLLNRLHEPQPVVLDLAECAPDMD